MCREQNVGYLDGVGNCWIAAPGLFVHVAGRPNRPTVSKVVDPFSKKASRIVRTLLTHSQKGWQVQQLAQQADVSLGLVSKAKTALVEDAYLEERDRLLFVRDGVKLLQGWSAEYRPHVKRVQLFAIPRPNESEKRLAEWCRTNKVTYALTQLAAAWRYSPMVRYDKSVAYIDRKLETGNKLKSLLEHLDAKEVETGANCTLSERKKEKDAYDICFCIENYHGGYKKLAEEFRGKTDDKLIAEGIGILREKFERLDSIGPVWAAQTAEEATAGTGFDLEMEQRRAYEIVNVLLREIESVSSK